MKKILSLVLFVFLAFAVNAQSAGAGPLVICGAGESCPPDQNGHYSSGVVPYAPDVNSEYFPEIRTCEPLDLCITLHCPASINLSNVGLGSGSISLRGVEVKGFGGLPQGVEYCLSSASWQPDGYYTLHLTGVPTESGVFQLKLSAVLSGAILSVNTDTFFPNGMDAIQVPVVDGPALVAGFTADATSITAGSAVNFTNTSTGYQATRTWTFEGGNPATSNEENPRVIYSTPGTYAVTLHVTNACGEDTKTETSFITVTEALTGDAPVADFSFATTQTESGFTVQFSDLSTNLPTSWNWTFEGGEPATSTEQNPVVAFATEGEYNVTLVAENEFGADTLSRTINVVDVESYSLENVSVYPNPTSSILNIAGENIISVEIFDITGKMVYRTDDSCSEVSVDMENFAASTYMVKIETENGSIIKKVMKQ